MKENSFLQYILEILNYPNRFFMIVMIPLLVFVFVMAISPRRDLSKSDSERTNDETKKDDTKDKGSQTPVLSPANYTLYGTITERQGMIFRQKPDGGSEKIDTIPYYTKVKILDAATGPIETFYGKPGRWLKIEYKGTEGWVFGSFVKIDPPRFTKLKATISNASGNLSKTTNYSYEPKNAFDDNLKTLWAVEGSNTDEWIEAEFQNETVISKLEISNGFSSNPKFWKENSRVKELSIECRDGNEASVKAMLYDITFLQDIYLPYLFQCKRIRFTVRSLYTGTKEPDTCITEIKMFKK